MTTTAGVAGPAGSVDGHHREAPHVLDDGQRAGHQLRHVALRRPRVHTHGHHLPAACCWRRRGRRAAVVAGGGHVDLHPLRRRRAGAAHQALLQNHYPLLQRRRAAIGVAMVVVVSSALQAPVPRLQVGYLGYQNVHVVQRLGQHGSLVFLHCQQWNAHAN